MTEETAQRDQTCDPGAFIPSLTAIAVMRVGRVKLLPFYPPGDAETGKEVKGVGGRHSAAVLAHRGPVRLDESQIAQICITFDGVW